jgi:hypothetical protein
MGKLPKKPHAVAVSPKAARAPLPANSALSAQRCGVKIDLVGIRCQVIDGGGPVAVGRGSARVV